MPYLRRPLQADPRSPFDVPRPSAVLILCALLSACDSQVSQEEFQQTAPPLDLSVEVLGPSPVRDTLRVRVTGLNTTETLSAPEVWLDGDRAEARQIRLDRRTVDLAMYVSEREGTLTLTVQASDHVTDIVGGDTLFASREAMATVRPVVERTLRQRLVTGTSPYESSVSDVFHDHQGNLWVRLSDYRSSFWSSPDGTSFTRRRHGFERFMAVDGATAWIETVQSGSPFLSRVDLATGETVADYRVYFNEHLHAGASFGGEFYGIRQSRKNLMHVRDGKVLVIESGPYALSSNGRALLDYHISPDGVHWLATVGGGVLRNDGSGWTETVGLALADALAVVDGPKGSVWALAADDGRRCVVSEWDGGSWSERAVFERDGNSSCGTFTVGPTGGVWRGTTDGWIVRLKGGVVDRRYRSESATSFAVAGETVWVGTGYGLREIHDYE